jgi:hypothetical protein
VSTIAMVEKLQMNSEQNERINEFYSYSNRMNS